MVLLGVASLWDYLKGLYTMVELSRLLPGNYQVIVVGVSKQQRKKLLENIMAYERTHNIEELRYLYAEADIFVSPTIEDNYPMTNLESIACGTPVITYATGGSSESAELYGNTCRGMKICELFMFV